MELDDKLYRKLTAICEKGNDYADRGKYEKALKCFQKGLSLIPLPAYEWSAAAWCYASIGDMQYFLERNEEALDSFMQAMKCPDGINAFTLLRTGQCFYRLSNMPQAKEYLLRAYMLEGEKIFSLQEDKIYLSVIKDMK